MNGRGFKKSPADFYNFAYWKKEPSLHRINNLKYCINGKPFHAIYMDQIKQFVDRMNLKDNQNKNFFSYNMFSSLSHDRFEIPDGFDVALHAQLSEFERNGFLDNTLLIVLTDHGGRPYAYGDEAFSKFAGLEYPNSFLSIKLPRNLRDTTYGRNFIANKDKLVTSFDLYKTLKHFYYLTRNGNFKEVKCRRLFSESVGKVRALRGVSLFESVPVNRSCREALIPIQFCTCISKVDVDADGFLKETGINLSNAAKVVVDKLNKKIEHLKEKCAVFVVKSVESVKKIVGDDRNSLFELSVLAEPGDARFKALIQVRDGDESKIELKSRISRENKYGEMSACLKGDDREFRDSCYCLKQD